MVASFENNYPQNMWANIDTKTRDWYVPDLYRVFVGQAVYNNFIGVKFNMAGLGALNMHVDVPVMPHTSTDAIGARDLWLDTSYMDSMRRTINFSQYGGKFTYNKYDQMITFWRQNGVQGLRRLIDQGMGYQITWTLEKLARNALLSNPFATYGTGTGTLFDTIEASDIMTTQKIRDMWLGLEERGVPYAQDSSFQTPGKGNVFCITTPGVIADLIDEASSSVYGLAPTFTDVSLYGDPSRAINGEVGTYQGVRFIRTNNACLYNAGDIEAQTTIDSAVSAGDGAPDPANATVDSVWKVGQADATHTITVASSSGFAVDDFVTIHKLRTSSYGVTNGVNWTDGSLHNRRIVSIPDGTHIVLDKPVLVDFTTDLGGGVYGYVTKGRNVHTAVFLSGANFDGVVNGIMQPPLIHTPDPVDDRQVQYRFTWDAYLKYQLWNPASYEVLFLAGSNRIKGARFIS